MEKNKENMTMEEILRQQFDLLAEHSKTSTDEELPSLTTSMIEIYKLIYLP